jgi:mono/diheme cytochrome c family protein
MYLAAVLLLFLIASASAQVTYSREVSRIIQQKCRQCHRPNDIAPFALTSYEDAASRSRSIRNAVEHRIMPPWKPVAGHGEFRDSLALTEEERNTILAWIDADAPKGDPADLPESGDDTGEWALGEPDLVLNMPEPYRPPADVSDTYRCFVLPSGLAEDKFVSAVDVLPGNRQTVHHVLLFIDVTGRGEELDQAEEGPGYTCFGGPRTPLSIGSGLGGRVPGTRARHLQEGVGIELPRGARVIMQVHYNSHTGHGHEAEESHSHEDQTRVGIYFSREKVRKHLLYLPIVNTQFEIPPGAQDHEVRASLPIFFPAKAILVAPHMHLLGRQIKLDLEEFGGSVTPLVYIDDWDFHWQGFYTYQEPVPLRFGSRVRLSCRFDNSVNNFRNPNNPPQPVRWGEGTADEMCLAFLGVTFDFERIP